jgi:hypothetical protein
MGKKMRASDEYDDLVDLRFLDNDGVRGSGPVLDEHNGGGSTLQSPRAIATSAEEPAVEPARPSDPGWLPPLTPSRETLAAVLREPPPSSGRYEILSGDRVRVEVTRPARRTRSGKLRK